MSNTSDIWDSQKSIVELIRLSMPEVLGFYSRFEITEVFAISDSDKSVHNVFTIAVAVEDDAEPRRGATFLSEKPVSLKSLRGWKFGAQQYTKPTAELIAALQDTTEGEWKLSGGCMKCGCMIAVPPSFIPPDFSERIPLNRVLKNNFWNGSYVFEWIDSKKTHLTWCFENPKSLQEMSVLVNAWVPLELASLADRLGNLIVQVPASIVMTRFSKSPNADGIVAHIAWHPKAKPRQLRTNFRVEWDKSVAGYTSETVSAPDAFLPIADTPGSAQGVIWDDKHRVILAATHSLQFIKTIGTNIVVIDPEPRIFTIPGNDGAKETVKIQLRSQPIESYTGAPPRDPVRFWTQRRIYEDQLTDLLETRRFIQYRPDSNNLNQEHNRALGHIHDLINQYGAAGVWLWDPFLSAMDVLKTLMYCPHENADLRALTATKRPKGAGAINSSPGFIGTDAEKFIKEQRLILSGIDSNWRGLRLEYRAKQGQVGWDFHDRFLIFPQGDKAALVWSLGTSVNGLGKAHHILQQVDNGQLILEAFQDLWDVLDIPDCLVWKKP